MTRRWRTLGLALSAIVVASVGWRLGAAERDPTSRAAPAIAASPPKSSTTATSGPPALPVDAPEAIRTLVVRFDLGDALEEYRHLDAAELFLQMDDLRAERQALEAETARLDAQHSQALEAGDRGRVVQLRRAIVDTVTARNRLAASLLLAGYVQSVSAAPDPGT